MDKGKRGKREKGRVTRPHTGQSIREAASIHLLVIRMLLNSILSDISLNDDDDDDDDLSQRGDTGEVTCVELCECNNYRQIPAWDDGLLSVACDCRQQITR